MSDKWFQSEKMYQCTMMVARNLLKQGIISEKEYARSSQLYQGSKNGKEWLHMPEFQWKQNAYTIRFLPRLVITVP